MQGATTLGYYLRYAGLPDFRWLKGICQWQRWFLRRILFQLSIIGAVVGGSYSATATGIIQNQNFERVNIAEGTHHFSFVTSADIDKDQFPELIVSVFPSITGGGESNGSVVIFRRSISGDQWLKTTILDQAAGIKYPNKVSAVDLDGDGDFDLVVPYGFLACQSPCGGLLWLENAGGQWLRHDVVNNGNEYFYHGVASSDLNGDGVLDLVTVAESKSIFGSSDARTEVAYGSLSDGALSFSRPLQLGTGGGSFPFTYDVDGDSDLDILSAQYFAADANEASAVWFENTGSTWVRHAILKNIGPSIQLSVVPDLFGNRQDTLVISNHTNTRDRKSDPPSAVYRLVGGEDLRTPWTPVKISDTIASRKSGLFAPQAAPGVFHWGDVDGDGDRDIVVSGDGDPNIYLLSQGPAKSFEQSVLISNSPQSGVHVSDLDADGRAEVVVSNYENKEIYYLKRR
jgi:hypothetical protein